MRPSLIAALLFAACAGSDHSGRQPPPILSKRDLTMKLQTDRGVARLTIDGQERLVAKVNAGNNVLVDLRAGDHPFVLRGQPSEYGGMGLKLDLTSGQSRVLALSCIHPCDDAQLASWATALRADAARLSHACAGTEIRGLETHGEAGGVFEVHFTLHVTPLMTEAERRARGCD